MITTKRLRELMKDNNADLYYSTEQFTGELIIEENDYQKVIHKINISEIEFIEVTELKENKVDLINKMRINGVEYSISLLYETLADAIFSVEFRNIRRTEYLSLTDYDTFCKYPLKIFDGYDLAFYQMRLDKENNIVLEKVYFDNLCNAKVLQVVAKRPKTRYDYNILCYKCRELFLGEDK